MFLFLNPLHSFVYRSQHSISRNHSLEDAVLFSNKSLNRPQLSAGNRNLNTAFSWHLHQIILKQIIKKKSKMKLTSGILFAFAAAQGTI